MNVYFMIIFCLVNLDFGRMEQFPVQLIDHSVDKVTAHRGQTVIFHCTFTGSPTPNVTWVKAAHIIETNDRLTIWDVGSDDTGTYECQGMNFVSETVVVAQHSFTLEVVAPPDPPFMVAFSGCIGSSAVVMWTPGFDNFSPITRFYVEDSHSYDPGVWKTAAIVQAPQLAATVMLTPFASYTFRVIAENGVGKSQPSEPTRFPCVTDSARPYRNPSGVHTDRSKTGWLIIKWEIMPEIDHNGPGFRYTIIVSKDGETNTFKINDWTENTKEVYFGTVYEPYEILVEAENDQGKCPVPAVIHIGYTGEAAPLVVPGNFELVGFDSNSSATFQWDPVDTSPEQMRGEFKGYRIRYWKVDEKNTTMTVVVVPRLSAGYGMPVGKETATVHSLPAYSDLEADIVAANTYFISGASNVISFSTQEGADETHTTASDINTTVAGQREDNPSQNDSSVKVLYDKIRLPQSLRPKLYNITIQPFVYGKDPKDFSFACEAIIHMDCNESTNVILIHSVGHNITSISIENKTGTMELVNFSLNREIQMLQIESEYTLTEGEEYILTIRSESSMSESLSGFYYSPYKEGNQTKYIFTTMMEPTDARRVFPCFDEPDFKAVFIFNIMRKEEFKSVTNLPKRLTIGPNDDGYYTDIFDEPRNVPMSTYLVAIVIGDLANLTSTVNNVTFRTLCRSREVNKTRYALEIGMKFMEFFEDYFQIPYSLPKADMIAVPTMSFSGMEHWGLITYRESMMFYEEGISSLDDKEIMTIIIAHEVAHQWFGNLVSPYWWDDLWLNEGFATYMMFLAVDRVLPDWNMGHKLITETRGVHNVMQDDDDNNTHPVYVSVYDPDEIKNIFDLISYAKGGSVIRMMNFFLGEDTFRKGLTRYLKDFSYTTATHNDLWYSLSQQAVVDNHTFTDVKGVMDTWVLEENYPVLTVSLMDDNRIQITQSAFLETAEQRAERSHVTWKLPFVYTTDIERNFDKTFNEIVWISNKTTYVTDESTRDISWIIGNIQQYGFYRVNYEEDNWNALLDQLITNHTVIHPINRAQIINDAWNLARAGLLDMKIALRTLDYLDAELDFAPWKAALRELTYVKSSLQLTSLYGAFEDFMRRTLTKAYFTTAHASDHYNRLQYSMISKVACEFGLPGCINDAMDMFGAWKEDINIRVDPNLKEMVYCTGVKQGGREAWAHVLRQFIDCESTSEKRFLRDALTCSQQPWLLMRLSEMLFDSDVFSKTDKVSVLIKLSETPTGRLLSWNVLENNWNDIRREFGEDLNLFSGIISATTHSFNTQSELNRVRGFLQLQQNLGTARKFLERQIDLIEANIKWKNQYYDTIKAWLTT